MIFCGYEGKPGEKAWVEIPVPDAKPIDAMLCCGMQEGKTLIVTAGVHGCEYVGIEAVRRLAEELDPAQMCGNVILLPLVNAEGFFQGAKQVVPEDNENLNRVFPGEKGGTLSRRIAYAVESSLYPCGDFLIDLHSGDCNESLFPLVFFPSAGKKEVNDRALEAAKWLSVPYRVKSVAKNGLYSWAVQKELPSLLIERGANGRWSEDEVLACMEDVFRIMSYLEICSRSYERIHQTEITEAIYEEAQSNGFWYPDITSGERVSRGQRLGRLQSSFDGRTTEIRAAFDGVILYYTTALGVRKKDPLVAYGRV